MINARHTIVGASLIWMLVSAAAAQAPATFGPYREGMSMDEARATAPGAQWELYRPPGGTSGTLDGPRIVVGGASFMSRLMFTSNGQLDVAAGLYSIKMVAAPAASDAQACAGSIAPVLDELVRRYGPFDAPDPAAQTVGSPLRLSGGGSVPVTERTRPMSDFTVLQVSAGANWGAVKLSAFATHSTYRRGSQTSAACEASIDWEPGAPARAARARAAVERAAVAAAKRDPARLGEAPIIPLSSVTFVQRPGGQDFARAYPSRAVERERGGMVVLDCLIGPSGTLDCAVQSEEPIGWGFADAALRLVPLYRVAPGPAVVGKRIQIEMPFRIASE